MAENTNSDPGKRIELREIEEAWRNSMVGSRVVGKEMDLEAKFKSEKVSITEDADMFEVMRNSKVVETDLDNDGKPRLKIVYIHCFDWSKTSKENIGFCVGLFLKVERGAYKKYCREMGKKVDPPMYIIVVQDKDYWPGSELEDPLVLERRVAKEKEYKECPYYRFKPDYKTVEQKALYAAYLKEKYISNTLYPPQKPTEAYEIEEAWRNSMAGSVVNGKVMNLGRVCGFKEGYTSSSVDFFSVMANSKVVEVDSDDNEKPSPLKIVYIHCFDWSDKSKLIIDLVVSDFLDEEREAHDRYCCYKARKCVPGPMMIVVVQDKDYWPGSELEDPLVLERRLAKEKAYKEALHVGYKPDYKTVDRLLMYYDSDHPPLTHFNFFDDFETKPEMRKSPSPPPPVTHMKKRITYRVYNPKRIRHDAAVEDLSPHVPI